jgi:homoserine kinase
MKSGIKVSAPATVSNLACGFDTLGMAIDVTCDEIIGKLTDKPGVHITGITGQKREVPIDPATNTAAVAVHSLLRHLGEEGRGIELKIHKYIPAGSGLGSSASSAVAAVIAANELLDRPLDKKALIEFALDGESFSTGARHGDNVVPAMMGGLMLIRDIETLDFHRVFVPPGLFIAIVLPDVFVSTKSARGILNPMVPLGSMVRQSANLGSLIIGMQNADLDLIKRSLVDHVIEHQRKHLIPHFDEIKNLALEKGALGCSISGAGPSIFALCHERSLAEEISAEMKEFYAQRKMNSFSFSGGINHEGARLM